MGWGRTENLMKDFRSGDVVLSPAQVETALALEEMLKPAVPEHGRKRKYLSGSGDRPTREPMFAVAPRRGRMRVGRGGK